MSKILLVYLVSVLVLKVKDKRTTVPVHTMNASNGSGGVAPLLTNLGTN